VAIQQQQTQEQSWQPQYDAEQTRRLIKAYQESPARLKPQIESIRQHAQYHNVPFYEGEFSVLGAIQQAGAGLLEGFTTLRVGEHPDNEYEAIARNLGHLVGFVPGILSGPLKALGVMKAAQKGSTVAKGLVGMTQLKSGPMIVADYVTKRAKKIVKPIANIGRTSKVKAASDATQSLFQPIEIAKHMTEGAFHLGTASAVSSIWDGVDQMMHSFVGGAVAGGVFRGMGNLVPGTTAGDKAIRGIAGGIFQGMPSTLRGATTPEQIYEYLAGAYFGANERPWLAHKTAQVRKEFEKQSNKNPKLEWERNPEDMDGWDAVHPLVKTQVKKEVIERYGTPDEKRSSSFKLMEIMGITENIPAEDLTTKGYGALSNIRKGYQKKSRKTADEILGVAASGGAKGADALWSKTLEKYGLPVIHFMPETQKKFVTDYFNRRKKGMITGVDRGLNQQELFEAGPKIERANQTLKRVDLTKMKEGSYDFIARNWFQVKNANSVYAIGEIEYGKTGERASLNGRTVKGGTGWATQMAIDKGIKKVYVYDQVQKEWFQWNNNKGRFSKITEAPKLTRNSAVIGTRKINDAGKQAIKEVAQKTFGEAPVTKSKAKDAVPEKEVGVHSKTQENIELLESEIRTRQIALDDIALDLKENKIPRSKIKETKEEVTQLKNEIADFQKEVDKHKALDRTQFAKDPVVTADNIVNDLDIGTVAQAPSLMAKSEYFSTEHLKEVWDIKDSDATITKRTKMLEAGKVVEESIRMHTELGNKNVKFKEAIKYIEDTLNLKNKLSEGAQRDVMKWLREQNLGKQVIFVKTNKKDLTFTNPANPTSSSGKTLKQVEPPKLIEEVYISEGGKLEKGVAAPLVVFDSVYVQNKKGFSVDVPLNKLVMHLRFNQRGRRVKEEEAMMEADMIKGDVIKEMAKKHNMYPMGGQGDKGRINFVKFHPNSRKNVENKYNLIEKALESVDKNAVDLLRSDRALMLGHMGISHKDSKKMIVSNMLYDLNLNGFKFTSENIKKVIGKGFIPSAIAYNKRAQIWMTNGYSGNKEYIKESINDMSGVENFTTEKGSTYVVESGNRTTRTKKARPEHPGDKGLKQTSNATIYLSKKDLMSVDSLIRSGNKIINMELGKDLILDKNGLTIKGKNFKGSKNPEVGLHPFEIWTGSKNGKKMVAKAHFGNKIVKTDGGHFNYVLIGDPSKPKGLSSLKALNIQLPEHVDGAILVRQDVIDAINKDAAHPSSGQNKSFIIDNTPFKGQNMGALLGKYMMHTVGEKASAEMKKKGLHFMIMTSAAKQTGLRKVGDYEVGKNNELTLKGTETYQLDPGSIKYNSSVINDHHMAQRQIWVKQLFTNLSAFGHSAIPEEMIEDIHRETIQKAYDGKPEINKEVKKYLSNLDNSKIDFLIKNLEDIGTNELISLLKTPGAERFSEMAMQRMLRVVEKDIEHSFQDGEITADQRADAIAKIRDSISPIDRLLKNVAIVGEEAARQGKAGYSGYLHKHVKDYRAAVLHNYFVKSITRPIADNSAVARMRPFDKWMQKDFKDLNTRDDIFYLDDAYKDTQVKLADGKTKTLGQLWASGKKEYKDIFNALVLRVPMDSISGAHKLEFKGFTGRKGHGIMLHARSMRALGGADLDGDEAFIYFGGKKEDGTGYGMKQSWIEAIHKNKSEFYKDGDVMDNKAEFRDLLTIGAGDKNPLKTSKALYYSPYSRLKASEGAVTGRDLLGVIVSQAQTMRSAHNSLMGAEGKKESFDFFIGKDKYRVTLTPKESEKERRYQRELTRAQIAFGSDPLDEAGLKHPDVFFETLHNSYFNKSFQVKKNNKGKFKKTKEPSGLKPYHLKGGILGSYKKMNSAYFSKNYSEGRRWTMDEVNHMASDIRLLTEGQKNTMLPKIVDTLEGLDWSDNLFNRIDLQKTKDAYREINLMAKEMSWLKPLLGRASFKVPYTDQINTVIANNLQNRHVRRAFAEDDSITGFKNLIRIVNNTPWKKEILNKEGGFKTKFLYDSEYRLNMLNEIVRQSEDFMSNDLADMATLMNVKRILKNHKISDKKISEIHARTETFKKRSYLSVKERRELDTGSYLDSVEGMKDLELTRELYEAFGLVDPAKQDLKGDKRSATWDQMQLDKKIFEYKAKLNEGEKELFDHLMIGTYNRANYNKVFKFLNKLSKDKYNPMLRSLVSKLIKEASGTKQSRLAINSEAIEDSAIQNHFRSMNDIYGKMWEQPTEETINKKSKEVKDKVEDVGIGKDLSVMDDLVQGAHKGEGYAGLKPGEVNKRDLETITTIATILKKYNNKLGNNIPDLNEQIRGIMFEAAGRAKDLNAMHRQDFEIVKNWLVEAENGTMFNNIWKSKTPEIQKRYYSLFPKTIDRELMAYDIKWLKKEGWFTAADGTIKKGIIRRPTYFLDILQNWIHKSNSLAQSKAETISKEIENDFIGLSEYKEGNSLFKVAVAQREQGIIKSIDRAVKRGDITAGEGESAKITYYELKNNTEKEVKWPKLKDKQFTIHNDKGQRVSATGSEIVNGSKEKSITGINKKLSKRFENLHKLIRGDEKAFERYKTGKYYDPETKTQPIMNWRKFIKDVEASFERGDDIPMELGIDGMRHVMRSMMHDLGMKGNNYNKWVFNPTGKFDFNHYWPHMFFDKAAAEKSMNRALKKIQEDPNLSKEEKQKALEEVVMKHKSLTGEWMFGDMGDWEKVDVFEMQDALESVASKKSKRKDTMKWNDMKISTGSLFNRKGHVEGWSTDMNVLDAYVKNITSTYYRQLNQIVGRNTIAEAKKRMSKKFGFELATRWENFFKLYVQGAMGQPDVIPDYIYNDPKMKLKGTPYAWFADNKVLDRVNNIREKLGIDKKNLPKKLQEFTYQDIKNWSNLEAQFELAALLAHPKSAVTNLFGGSLHTVQSAGLSSLRKARNIKWLKRINPEWKSMEDVMDFVVKKGVVPEFMIHELGLGREALGVKSIENFIGDLSSKINSNEKISRREIYELGRKHSIKDNIVAKAAKFMSVPERILRRDAFMAHYVKAWERYGGAITDPNHPFLIEMAKKGVKATQFLYEAPFRPFFARTALGKVMTRFQLYAWNSVRMRNDIMREAARYGYKPGTEAFNKFKRTMTIDLFVMALGSMYMYSIFDTAMPQPYSWLQDTANWMFGDEKERERAFYGTYPTAIAPLQMISPPISRIPMAAIMAYAKGDWEKLTGYQIYTMFPFGRIVRDVAQPGRGLIDNPSRLPEKMLGLPLQDISRFNKQRKENIEENKRYNQPKPGIF
jgi:hypothetical protein